MAYKPKAPPVMAAPNVIPMADIMLVLLIIFMVITPMLQKGLPVNMAKAENAEKMPNADRDDAIIVAVTRDGQLFLGSTKITLDEITGDVKDQLANRLDKTVYVRSDARTKFGPPEWKTWVFSRTSLRKRMHHLRRPVARISLRYARTRNEAHYII